MGNAKSAGAPVAASVVLIAAYVLKLTTDIEIPADVQTALAGVIGWIAHLAIPSADS